MGVGEHPDLPAEDVLSIVDHELGNLAMVIVGLCDGLERRWDELDDAAKRAISRRVRAQSLQLATLLANLRTLRSRGSFALDIGEYPVDAEPSKTIAAMVDDLRQAAPEHAFEADIAPDILPMRLDVSRLGQVLRNLVQRGEVLARRVGDPSRCAV